MSDIEPGRPRRALEPLDDDGDDALDEPAAQPSRRAWSEVGTPIPPPAPALPEPAQPTGRRFSAEPATAGWVGGAPRRSAASVSSPPSRVDDVVEAAVVEPDGAKGKPKRRLYPIVGVAAAIVLIVSLIVFFTVQRTPVTATPPSGDPSVTAASPSATAGLDAAHLLAASDLGDLRKDATWTQADGGATPQAACVELSSTGGMPVAAEQVRGFTSEQAKGTLVQVVQAYDSPEAATTAHDALLGQLAACSGAQLVASYRLDGTADAAQAMTLRLADGANHTAVLTRTGRFVNLADAAVTGGPPIGITVLGRSLATSLTKQCAAAGGACPGTVKPVAVPPPATDLVGWLAWVDLPQITAGTGTWTATDPVAPKFTGSQCEVVDLNKLPGADEALHRTYLLTDDAKAPKGFGVDEAVYTFGKSSEATTMARRLDNNFDSCGDRTRTATVTEAGVSAVGSSGKELSGRTYEVTQRISDTRTVSFRVGVVAVGERLVYLFANPSADFDFNQDAWTAVVGRAAQRATQFG